MTPYLGTTQVVAGDMLAAHVGAAGTSIAARTTTSASMATWPGVTVHRVVVPARHVAKQAQRGTQVGTVVALAGVRRAAVPVRLTPTSRPRRCSSASADSPSLTPCAPGPLRRRPISGPGFDTLAVALECYVSVEVEEAPSLRVRTEGEGAGLFDDASHLAARVVAEVWGHDRFAVTVRSQIPVARGLGSSAALAAAAAAAAGADDPFAVAAAYDGHPENAAASVFGGLVAATMVEGRPVSARSR